MTQPPRNCQRCPRFVALRKHVHAEYSGHHAAPVPESRPADAQLPIVGRAPGMQGANVSGRVFTGDHSGVLF